MPPNLVSERDFQASIVDLARLCGWRVVHFHDSRREVGDGVLVGDSDAKGWPDLTLIRDRILYREVKTERGRVTKSQDRMLVALLAAGGDAKVWRPSNWDEIQEVLAR